jgi:predicted metal-dependent hydrolase
MSGKSEGRRPEASGKRTIRQDGRLKAYRPISPADRRTAYVAGLAAFERGDVFLAHELLEPAWMGTDYMSERDLYQGLIKLAAAEVHAVRGNAAGVAKNLRGALLRLRSAEAGDFDGGLDLAALRASTEARLAAIEAGGAAAAAAARPLADATLARVGRDRTDPAGSRRGIVGGGHASATRGE